MSAALTDSDVARIIRVHRGSRAQAEHADRLLLHIFQHQTHHRGQAHAVLSGSLVAPSQLDEFYSLAEAPLRAKELAALGWTEHDLWPESP